MDDVTFGRNWPYGASGGQLPGRSLSMNALLFLESAAAAAASRALNAFGKSPVL